MKTLKNVIKGRVYDLRRGEDAPNLRVNSNPTDHSSGVVPLQGDYGSTKFSGIEVDRGWAWCIMVATFIGCFLSGGMSYSFGIYYTELIKLHPSKGVITGLLTGLPGSLILVVGPLSIYVAEKALTLGGLCGSLGFILSSFTHNLYALCVTLGLMFGFGSGMVLAPTICALKKSFDRHYLIAHSGGVSGIACGYLTLPFVFRYLIDTFGLSGSLLINGAIFLNTLVAATMLKKIPITPKLTTSRKRRDLAGELALSTIPNIVIVNVIAEGMITDQCRHESIINNTNSPLKLTCKILPHAKSTKLKVTAFLIYGALEQAGVTIITVLIPYYAESLGMSPFKSSSMVSLIGFGDFSGSLVVILSGFVAKAFSSQDGASVANEQSKSTSVELVASNDSMETVTPNYKSTLWTAIASTPKNVIFFHGTVVVHVLLSLAYLTPIKRVKALFVYLSFLNYLFGMSYGIRLSLLTIFIVNGFGADRFTKVYGRYVLFAGLGSLFSVPLSSWLIDVFGSAQTIFYLICIILTVCEALLCIASRIS